MAGTAAGAALLGQLDEPSVAVAKAIATEGATAITAPVSDVNGTTVAALSAVGPSVRMPPRVITRYGEQLRVRAAELSDLLGGKSA
ncbi:hypothetical protein ACQEWB_49600 [Streptomyces sp. CA-249302]|uniref:hypothetical protein n=1 Tax=Streptomyces sp. CA-249302 TaxID=3240058 RepID=UPI003D8AD567